MEKVRRSRVGAWSQWRRSGGVEWGRGVSGEGKAE